MDYIDHGEITRHASWGHFIEGLNGQRLVLLSTKASDPYTACLFEADDILLLGRESAGVPDEVHDRADKRVLIPMAAGTRSLNVALAGAMVLGEALRQTNGFP